jgi:hypothetical protein
MLSPKTGREKAACSRNLNTAWSRHGGTDLESWGRRNIDSLELHDKIQMFGFANKDLGASCWGKSPQLREAKRDLNWSSSPACSLKKETVRSSSSIPSQKTLKPDVPPFYFLCFSLSVLLTSSYSLWFVPTFTPCLLPAHLSICLPYSLCFFPYVHSLVACSTSWLMVDFI